MRLTTRALTTKGNWPGPLTLRRGWARADARPWNGEFADAHLRLVRGGSGFISDSAQRLLDLGAPSVISPPLPESSQRPWRSAGFTHHTELHLLRLALDPPPAAPSHLVVAGSDADLPEVLRIDHLAFAPFWRLDERGLVEAIDATPRAELLVINNAAEGLCGFAILGLGSALAYLQRVAVAPAWQGQGMGRSLVRVSARRARELGATAMLLNTQIGNDHAMALYASEGFATLREPLRLLRLAS
jgi:ribosomal protein S18 acetylase RimI-like enzyme